MRAVKSSPYHIPHPLNSRNPARTLPTRALCTNTCLWSRAVMGTIRLLVVDVNILMIWVYAPPNIDFSV